MKDPYNILNIDKKASDADLKRAYRQQARKHHPDHGGDKDKFSEISWAYQLLSSPNERAYYDQYGKEETDQDKRVYGIFMGYFNTIIIRTTKIAPKSIDIIKTMNAAVDDRVKDINEQIRQCNKLVNYFSDIAGRIKRKTEGENYLQNVAQDMARDNVKRVNGLNEEKEVMKQVKKMIDEYEYKTEVPFQIRDKRECYITFGTNNWTTSA